MNTFMKIALMVFAIIIVVNDVFFPDMTRKKDHIEFF